MIPGTTVKTNAGSNASGRIARELRTLRAMIGIFCRRKHGSGSCLCSHCNDLLEYSIKNTISCRFGKDKPVCSGCPVHCYSTKKREKIRNVMRHSGPRMILYHPWLALMHKSDKILNNKQYERTHK